MLLLDNLEETNMWLSLNRASKIETTLRLSNNSKKLKGPYLPYKSADFTIQLLLISSDNARLIQYFYMHLGSKIKELIQLQMQKSADFYSRLEKLWSIFYNDGVQYFEIFCEMVYSEHIINTHYNIKSLDGIGEVLLSYIGWDV